MNRYKIIYYFILFCSIILLTSCSKPVQKPNANELSIKNPEPKLTEVMALSMSDNKESLLKIEGSDLKKGESLSKVKDLCYNITKKVTVYLNILADGDNLTKSYVSILNNKESFQINGSYAYSDLRLSNSGTKLALRSFAKDSITSAEGLSVYSTENGKKLNFDKNVIVSGDLYRWKDDNNLIYYGVDKDTGGYGKIYDYDFKSNKSSVVFDKLQGYCTSFIPLNNGDIIYVENNQDKDSLKYYDSKKQDVTIISETFNSIDNYIVYNTGNEVYVIGEQEGIGGASLYKIGIPDKRLVKLTFDFPKFVDKTGGIAVDSEGKVYFCGTETEYGDANIYMYDKNNNSTNLISEESGIYHIAANSR